MAELTVQVIAQAGLNPSYGAAAAGGDTFENDGKTYLHVKNGGAGSITVTVDADKNCDQGFDHNASVAVPAGGERIIGPFPLHQYPAKPSVTYSGVTSVTVAAVRLPAK